MDTLTQSDSIIVARSPEDLYDMVSDVTRMGEWSPECRAGTWDDGAGPSVGSWFTGVNATADREWEKRCEVIAAERGREFAFVTEGTGARWRYTFVPVDGGREVTESWEFPPGAAQSFQERFGNMAEAHIAARLKVTQEGIPATLAALKRIAKAAG
jgi:Polyketide cyclase / dehydrase and lipid transport